MADTNFSHENDLRSIQEHYLAISEDIDKISERDGRVGRDLDKIRIDAMTKILDIDEILTSQKIQEVGS